MQDDKVIKTANNVYLLRGFSCCWVTGELSTLRQMMEVPNEPGCAERRPRIHFRSDQSKASKSQLVPTMPTMPAGASKDTRQM